MKFKKQKLLTVLVFLFLLTTLALAACGAKAHDFSDGEWEMTKEARLHGRRLRTHRGRDRPRAWTRPDSRTNHGQTSVRNGRNNDDEMQPLRF